jgi:hypothetical protein
MIKVTWTGRDSFMANARAFANKFPDVVGKALQAEGNIEATESKRRTPVDTGNLRASTHVEPYHRSGRDISVRIVVGGTASPYALFVHEDLEAHHKVGQAKFLQSTILESAPFMLLRVAARLGMRASV